MAGAPRTGAMGPARSRRSITAIRATYRSRRSKRSTRCASSTSASHGLGRCGSTAAALTRSVRRARSRRARCTNIERTTCPAWGAAWRPVRHAADQLPRTARRQSQGDPEGRYDLHEGDVVRAYSGGGGGFGLRTSVRPQRSRWTSSAVSSRLRWCAKPKAVVVNDDLEVDEKATGQATHGSGLDGDLLLSRKNQDQGTTASFALATINRKRKPTPAIEVDGQYYPPATAAPELLQPFARSRADDDLGSVTGQSPRPSSSRLAEKLRKQEQARLQRLTRQRGHDAAVVSCNKVVSRRRELLRLYGTKTRRVPISGKENVIPGVLPRRRRPRRWWAMARVCAIPSTLDEVRLGDRACRHHWQERPQYSVEGRAELRRRLRHQPRLAVS